MPNKRQMSKDHLRPLVVVNDDDDDGINNIDSNITESTDDIIHIQKNLIRSTESLYPFGTGNLQPISMRRLSHNLNNERRRSLLWVRPTTEQIIARANRRTSEDPKLLHPAQFNSARGLSCH
ncbi:unnamed protein product [Wuchereria bancrofti]|uniref:Uncharacterized protein n=1 Tax=Wuchereria bancrofti TaxID=6293 RepID=A0A3P7FTP9_WUCBA|nr:unnamed protein product [Wuchereria bancrofti]